MPINTKHQNFIIWSPRIEKTRDGIAGEDVVKNARFKYLNQLPGQLPEHYQAYLDRARFVNFGNRVLEMAIGQLYRKDPVIKGIPDEILNNVDLTGKSFIYWSREITREMMTTNRVGVLVDWNENQARPYVTIYKFENIINWREQLINGIHQLVMVMLEGEELIPDSTDPYKTKSIKIWKELILENIPEIDTEGNEIIDPDGNTIATPVYKVRDWQKSTTDKGKDRFVLVREYTPIINDKTFDYIPFYMCTTDGVSTQLQKAPIAEIVNVNFGHYRNSADYENRIHFMGTATIVVRGWDESKPFPVGGLAVIDKDGGAQMLEVSPNSSIEEAMKRKEEQMSILGAAMISGKGKYVASAQTANITAQGENANLADISNAMDAIMEKIFTLIMEWYGGTEDVEIEYNTDFENNEMNPQLFTALMSGWQSGAISWPTFFYNLKNKEMYPGGWTLEDEDTAIQETLETQIKRRDQKTPPMLQMAGNQKQIGNQQPNPDQKGQPQNTNNIPEVKQ